ncbi:uncharacterized protein LAJ45_05646 [Morchella importuna]|uniref:uncharacterized protein n=1 Tax=Morchella importuna TaxID=1174673 RepID=UPI001E8EA6BC|nr:uncharacterized protein LAJ45_05646 [Morchella importuna]KAH8150433.1 hypothetical protein LAJ45_05646 [Morchella importuna]
MEERDGRKRDHSQFCAAAARVNFISVKAGTYFFLGLGAFWGSLVTKVNWAKSLVAVRASSLLSLHHFTDPRLAHDLTFFVILDVCMTRLVPFLVQVLDEWMDG